METREAHEKIAIFGAGQAGLMASMWIPSSVDLLCFIDNDPKKQGTILRGFPVVSLDAALLMEPDTILLCVLNREAEKKIRTQIALSEFLGTCLSVGDLKEVQDIRLAALRLNAAEITSRRIEGDIAELGVYRGEFSMEMNRLLPDRTLWLFDTFSGFDPRDLKEESAISGKKNCHRDFSDTSIGEVREKLPFPRRAVFVRGYFPESLSAYPCLKEEKQKFALVSLDPDLYRPTYEGLSYFYPRLSPGGRILIHDYTSFQFEGVRHAVECYCKEHGLYVMPLMDLHGTGVLIK